ncbi:MULTISPECIES: DUF6338 family protein [unclassified Amycolatopsis]|uniref:DUF6338 family protein n=1 Tax=unclassified Amycolatopsis TaxID=2618356 RepID=UPI0037BFB14D
MPTTLGGLVLFVVLLLPGIAYVAVRERNFPDHRPSIFRETATVAAVSVAVDLLAVLLIIGVSTLHPDAAPNVGQLVVDSTSYFRNNVALVLWWALGGLIFATGLAALAGHIIGARVPHPSGMSSWWFMWGHRNETAEIHVNCILDDGSKIDGYLKSFSTIADDIKDRDLVLIEPIRYAYEKHQEMLPYGADEACISASRIVALITTYVPLGTRERALTGTTSSEASASRQEPSSSASSESSP